MRLKGARFQIVERSECTNKKKSVSNLHASFNIQKRVCRYAMEDEAWSASFAFRAWDTSTGHDTGTRGRWEDPEAGGVSLHIQERLLRFDIHTHTFSRDSCDTTSQLN